MWESSWFSSCSSRRSRSALSWARYWERLSRTPWCTSSRSGSCGASRQPKGRRPACGSNPPPNPWPRSRSESLRDGTARERDKGHVRPRGTPMTEEKWGAVDSYIVNLLIRQDDALDAAIREGKAAGLPAINVTPSQGKMLQILALMQGARDILEIGTLAGYSTIWLGRALPPDGHLITLELDPKHARIARAEHSAGWTGRCGRGETGSCSRHAHATGRGRTEAVRPDLRRRRQRETVCLLRLGSEALPPGHADSWSTT